MYRSSCDYNLNINRYIFEATEQRLVKELNNPPV